MRSYIERLWQRSHIRSQLSLFEKIFFHFLCGCEIAYRCGFMCAQFLARLKQQTKIYPFPVISIGNISAGGTGKSVFCSFLVTSLCQRNKQGALLLRGYKGRNSSVKKSYLVSDGKDVFSNVNSVGDEAFMFAKTLPVPVIIGKNRSKSADVLLSHGNKKEQYPDYVVLDDAYQHHSIKKQCEILLLDARHPFENNHCFPAGRLREKDCSRADIIILTHSRFVEKEELDALKKQVQERFNVPTFAGSHIVGNFIHSSGLITDRSWFENKEVAACAGIGSFSGFTQTLQDLNIHMGMLLQFPDHYVYTIKDIAGLVRYLKNGTIDCCITTRKDWYKIMHHLPAFSDWRNLPFFIMDINFAFLTDDEHQQFFKMLYEKLRWHSS